MAILVTRMSPVRVRMRPSARRRAGPHRLVDLAHPQLSAGNGDAGADIQALAALLGEVAGYPVTPRIEGDDLRRDPTKQGKGPMAALG